MATYILIKVLWEDDTQGEDCNEIIGSYAGAIKSESRNNDDLCKAACEWISDYFASLSLNTKYMFKKRKCSDSDVVACFDLYEDESDPDSHFESLYLYPLVSTLIKIPS